MALIAIGVTVAIGYATLRVCSTALLMTTQIIKGGK